MTTVDLTTPAAMRISPDATESSDTTFHFTKAPDEILDHPTLSHGAQLLYIHLVRFAWTSNRVWPGQERLAIALRVNVRTVQRYIDELIMASVLVKTKRGRNHTNIYTLSVFPENGAKNGQRDTTPVSYQVRGDTTPVSPYKGGDTTPVSYEEERELLKETQNVKEKENVRASSALFSKADAAERKRIVNAAKDARLAAHAAHVDALCVAAGIDRADLSVNQVKEWSQAFADSPMPLADIVPLVAYFRSQPWYDEHRERLTANAVTKAYAGWKSTGRPETAVRGSQGASRRDQEDQANSDDYFRLLQKQADDRGEVYKGVSPSYWTKGGGQPCYAGQETEGQSGSYIDVPGVVR